MDDEHHDYKISDDLSTDHGSYKIFKSFDCGLEVMNRFYKESLSRSLRSGNFRAIGAVDADGNLIGFCTLSYSELDRDKIRVLTQEKNLPRQVYCVRVIMLAVDLKFQRKGIAGELMTTAFEQAAKVNLQIPIKGICLDSAPGSVSYYEKLDFEKLDEADEFGSTPMFLRTSRMLAALEAVREQEEV